MSKRALISVSDKRGVVEFAQGLAALGFEIISTGGTAKALSEAGVAVRSVKEVAGFPEILDGRVKTLQPGIHGGILARRGNPEHMQQLAAHNIAPIDLVAVNLYPFRETVARAGVSMDEAMENVDIGGPCMVRAAAKNHADVIVVVDPDRYAPVLAELQAKGDLGPMTRRRLALEAFAHTAAYDAAISAWLRQQTEPEAGASPFPASLTVGLHKVQDLRYGENPHQRAAFYSEDAPAAARPSLVRAEQLHGKELSYNNINDAQAALDLVLEFDRPAAVAVKHTNPCGVGVADTLAEAYRKAYEADKVSIFGGIIALNRICDAATAEQIAQIFVEIVMAPDFDAAALAILTKKKNVRLLKLGPFPTVAPAVVQASAGAGMDSTGWDMRRVEGGMLVQDFDRIAEDPHSWRTVTAAQVPGERWDDLVFAWKVCKHVKSNTIVVVKDGQTLGVGAGQMNRIDAARHAIAQAGAAVAGAVLASDAFFPFPDVVEAAAAAKIAAIVQPGGSVRDDESIERANQAGLAMVFTGVRHFKH